MRHVYLFLTYMNFVFAGLGFYTANTIQAILNLLVGFLMLGAYLSVKEEQQ